jgi:hypothetical protein
MLRIVNPMREQHRSQVDVGEVTTVEIIQTVSSEVLDPFGSRCVIELGIRVLLGRVIVVAAHYY